MNYDFLRLRFFQDSPPRLDCVRGLVWPRFCQIATLASLILLLTGSSAYADSEKFSHEKVTVTLSDEGGSPVSTVKVPSYKSVDVFSLDAPPRIVIDLVGTIIGKPSEARVSKVPQFDRIRLGRYKDKVRVVFDLSGDQVPEYQLAKSPGTVRLTFGAPSKQPEPISATPAPTFPTLIPSEPITSQELDAPVRQAKVRVLGGGTTPVDPTLRKTEVAVAPPLSTPIPTPTPTSLTTPAIRGVARIEPTELIEVAPTPALPPPSTPTPTTTPTPVETPQATPTPTPKKSPTPTAVQPPVQVPTPSPTQAERRTSSAPTLEDIRFDYLAPDRTPVVRIRLSKKHEYRLNRKDTSTFTLVIPGATIDLPFLRLHQFPPNDFVGFTVVMPEVRGNNVEVQIGVDRGIRLASFVKDNEIWIKPTTK